MEDNILDGTGKWLIDEHFIFDSELDVWEEIAPRPTDEMPLEQVLVN